MIKFQIYPNLLLIHSYVVQRWEIAHIRGITERACRPLQCVLQASYIQRVAIAHNRGADLLSTGICRRATFCTLLCNRLPVVHLYVSDDEYRYFQRRLQWQRHRLRAATEMISAHITLGFLVVSLLLLNPCFQLHLSVLCQFDYFQNFN